MTAISLERALELTRTGDIWVFRGRSPADRAIQTLTNSPVNHVGMSLVVDDLPPLMWHAELGSSLPDLWSGTRHRGVQLHDMHDAVCQWGARYGQRAWLRQLDRPITRDSEDAALRMIARLDGTPFPSTARLTTRWFKGRIPFLKEQQALESAYCAEVVALTYGAMGLLPRSRRPNWYDPGRFWSGDSLTLADGYELGDEIAVDVPAPRPAAPPHRRRGPRPLSAVLDAVKKRRTR
ncbi:hypothetical protein [Actinocorallia aurantiaca]|uniref:Guanylate cyclase n=1 Tax=Actinocorallia aurantiaca TaxID=46204 RepID=A0ABN3U7D3_9ACTN